MDAVFQQIRARQTHQQQHRLPCKTPLKMAAQGLDRRSCVWPEDLSSSSNTGSAVRPYRPKRQCSCASSISERNSRPSLQDCSRNRALSVLQEVDDESESAEQNDENYPAHGSESWNSDNMSFAKRCETKLETLLNFASGNNIDAQRTDACFQVLEELCERKLPFSSFLRHICTHLKCAFYANTGDSNYLTRRKSFSESARELEQEISLMEAYNSTWKSSLLEQEKDLLSTQVQLQDVRDDLMDVDSGSNELEEKISATTNALASEEKKISGLHAKIKKLKQELKDIRHEVKQATHIESIKTSEDEQYAKLKTLYIQCVHEFQHVQECLRMSQLELAGSAPKADMLAAKVEILELGDKIYQAKSEIDAFRAATGHLTPRPQWGGQMPGMDKPAELSTARQIERICRENAFLAENISRLQLDFAASEAALSEGQGNAINSARSSSKKKPGSANSKKTHDKPSDKKTDKP